MFHKIHLDSQYICKHLRTLRLSLITVDILYRCVDTNFTGPHYSWWRHQMEPFSALLALCAGNSPVTGEFPSQRPVTRSFNVFFDLRLNERLSKQWWGWWFEAPSHPLWRNCNVIEGFCWRFYAKGLSWLWWVRLFIARSSLIPCSVVIITFELGLRHSLWQTSLWQSLPAVLFNQTLLGLHFKKYKYAHES